MPWKPRLASKNKQDLSDQLWGPGHTQKSPKSTLTITGVIPKGFTS